MCIHTHLTYHSIYALFCQARLSKADKPAAIAAQHALVEPSELHVEWTDTLILEINKLTSLEEDRKDVSIE